MATGKVHDGKPHAVNPHVRFDEGSGMPMRLGSPALCKKVMMGLVVVAAFGGCCLAPCGGGKRAAVKQVVLVGVDGLGARWIPWEKMPNLSKLRTEGHYAVGRANYPTSSAINWATAMFGTVVELHGYRNWNSKKPDIPAYEVTDKGIPPCIFHEIRRQDPAAYTISLYNWGGIGFVHATNEVDYVRNFPGGTAEERDAAVIDEGLAQLKGHCPKLSFLYQQLPDYYGHKCGWGTPEYTNACVHLDVNIGRLVKGLEDIGLRDSTAIILVSDHGGLDKRHGMDVIECFEVPFLVNGPAVNRGFRLREPVLLADTAPTVADLLGYCVPETWRGRPALVEERK